MALKKKAPQDLVALATLYYTTQVAGQRGTEKAKRRDISRFVAFYYDLFRHYHPRDWHTAVTRSFLKSLLEDKRLAQAMGCRVYASVRHFAHRAHKNMKPVSLWLSDGRRATAGGTRGRLERTHPTE